MTPEATAAAQSAKGPLEALGIRLGTAQLFSTADFEESYNSNIYATESSKKSDYITSFRPNVSARSDWVNHALNFSAAGLFRRYSKSHNENFTNYSLATNGRLDVLRNTYVTGGAGYQIAHEDRTSPDASAGNKSPIKYKNLSGRLGLVRDAGRIALRIDSGVDTFTYYDGITNAGTPVDEKFRDRTEYRVTPRASYKVNDRYQVFVQVPLNRRDYKRVSTNAGIDRTSSGFEIDAGGAINLTGKVSGELFVGYLEQVYSKPPKSTTADLGFGGRLLWSPSPLTTVQATLSRAVVETTVGSATGFLQTNSNLSVDHLIGASIVTNVGLSYSLQKYHGAARSDHVAEANLGANYLVNRYIMVGASTTYRRRTSDFPGGGFSQHVVVATLRLRN